jgi:hypothetical protein
MWRTLPKLSSTHKGNLSLKQEWNTITHLTQSWPENYDVTLALKTFHVYINRYEHQIL